MHVRVAFLLPHLPSPRGHFSDPPPPSLSLSLSVSFLFSLFVESESVCSRYGCIIRRDNGVTFLRLSRHRSFDDGRKHFYETVARYRFQENYVVRVRY